MDVPRDGGGDHRTPLRLTGLSRLMDLTSGAPEITIALIDGPVALGHPELSTGRLSVLPAPANAACADPDSVACRHGTAVAGILHAARESRVPGICPGCTLLLRPLFSGDMPATAADGLPRAQIADLAAALHDAIDTRARIVNLSIGLAEPSLRAWPVLDDALQRAAERGVLVIAAGGNQGALGGSALTRHPWVLPVVACGRDGQPLAASNLAASIGRRGLMAPGEEIDSLAPAGGHAPFSGSSAAVPFVSGTLALLWSLFPAIGANQLRLAIAGGPARRRAVTPPLLDAWGTYRRLASTPSRAAVS